jgi:uncharacterized membrane protein
MNDQKNSLGMDEKTASWFAYVISIISAIILLVTEKDNRNVRLHAWQALFLGCFFTAVYIVVGIIAGIVLAASISMLNPYAVGGFWVFSLLYNLLWIAWVGVSVICIVKAVQGGMFKIPVIYGWAEKMK